MRAGNPRLGPLALLLTVIGICLAILAVLSLSTAQADRRLAQRFAVTVAERWELEARGQDALRSFPAGFEEDEDGVYRMTVEQNGARLRIGVEESENGGLHIVEWRQEQTWEQAEEIGNLWPGKG